ncbi:hypothetical protein QN277_011805 [Acacia crassicarpa]|uniref:Uncharacterized protein n=1 Tax=Acacia crassicarpa TaxID=499986 RepID=A0AAE1TDV0_9FABA|nr:hypothetical protein QN277_011805 [Acacia crassicarpa]
MENPILLFRYRERLSVDSGLELSCHRHPSDPNHRRRGIAASPLRGFQVYRSIIHRHHRTQNRRARSSALTQTIGITKSIYGLL